VVEVALARLFTRGDPDAPIQLLRFANRVPLQFDKGACAITAAIESVNWKSYGLGQPKDSLPLGPYIFAISVVSPFIKFKNASKETIDASDELVEEIRRAAMQAGQKLSRFIRRETKEADLERKLAHIEQFGPILVEGLVRIVGANEARKKRASDGLRKLLGRDSAEATRELEEADTKLQAHKKKAGLLSDEETAESSDDVDIIDAESIHEKAEASAGTKKKATTGKDAAAPKTTAKAADIPKTTAKAADVKTTGKKTDKSGTKKKS
ncbi:MAG: hypothetical protein AB7H97_17835, partial [Pseudobdellovibrionaceae bacterium]